VECNAIIQEMYNSKAVNKLLSNIHPEDLREDLKQELAIVLLEYNCDKLQKMYAEGNLLKFTLQVLWNMTVFKRSDYNKKFKTNDADKLNDYLRSQLNTTVIDTTPASKLLQHKLTLNANEAHESMIFTKYVEFKNCAKVAKYFNIPHIHVFKVVTKTKEELKNALKNVD
jgi:hypothetical protein